MIIKNTAEPPSPTRIGIVGLGRAGWDIHLKQLKDNPHFRIVSVVDPDPVRAEEAIRTFACRAHSSIQELVDARGVDLVIVATPSFSHAQDATVILQAGLDCVLEKPMATSYQEAAKLVEIAAETGRKLFVHHQQPFHPEFGHLRDIIDSGVLGEIFHIDVYWSRYARRWDWQTLKKNGGGQLSNHGSHALSVLLPLLGSTVSTVSADLRNIKDAGDAEDHVNLLLKTESGRTASVIVTSVCAITPPRWRLLGSCGTLECDGTKSTLRYYDPTTVPPLEVIDAAAPGRAYLKEELPWQEETRWISSSPDAANFYSNVRDVLLGKDVMRVSPEDALEITRVIELARLDASLSNHVSTTSQFSGKLSPAILQ